MSDPAATAAAAVRAHMLLAEGHRPLTMTPGDLRALLARYQLRLQELADAVEPVTAVQGTEADPDPGVLFSLRAHRPGDYYIKVSEGSGAASADVCNSTERPARIDQPQMPDAENDLADPKPDSDESQRSSDDPQLGSAHDMRSRLRDLPHGHPSSPYNEDGSRRPPVLGLRAIDLPRAEEDRSSAASGGTQPLADAPSKRGEHD
jgi:hypothetical protein